MLTYLQQKQRGCGCVPWEFPDIEGSEVSQLVNMKLRTDRKVMIMDNVSQNIQVSQTKVPCSSLKSMASQITTLKKMIDQI